MAKANGLVGTRDANGFPYCADCEGYIKTVDEDGCCATCGIDPHHDEDGRPYLNSTDPKILATVVGD